MLFYSGRPSSRLLLPLLKESGARSSDPTGRECAYWEWYYDQYPLYFLQSEEKTSELQQQYRDAWRAYPKCS